MADNQIETFKKQLHRELQFREKTNRMMPEIPELKKAFRDREINKQQREKQSASNAESEHFKEMIQNQRERLNHVSNQKFNVQKELSRQFITDSDDKSDCISTTIQNNINSSGAKATVSAELENVFRQIIKKK